MNHSNLFVLYVADAARSRVFYEQLLQKAPTSDFPSFVSFELSNHSHLGLWSEQAANFKSGGSGHRMEVGFLVDTEALVEAAYQHWQALGIAIEQPLARAVFGLTFVGLDPDGHRLRVCMPD